MSIPNFLSIHIGKFRLGVIKGGIGIRRFDKPRKNKQPPLGFDTQATRPAKHRCKEDSSLFFLLMGLKDLLFTARASGLDRHRSYNLPQIHFLSNAIEDLELQCYKLELPRSCVKLSSLRKLSLRDVYMDDHTVKNLVCGCPLIEYLEFASCHLCEGFKSLELFGPITLNKIKIVRCQGVERLDINALNVRFLEIHGSFISCKVNIVFCKNLTHLKLSGIDIKDEWFYTQISKLSVLEVLNVSSSNGLKNVKISNPCLKELFIVSWWDLVELNIDTPKLHSLYYVGNMIFLSANALALLEISLSFTSKNVETQRFIELLANFHHFSEVLNLHINMSEMNVMVPSEVRETIPSPLSNLEVLNFVSYRTRPTVFKIAKVVDSLLWFAPHTKTISVDKDECSFEFTYKKQLIYEGEVVSCCKSLPISCWHHCMEAVKVVFKEGSNKIKYTLNGAGIWDKIVALCEVWQLRKSAGFGLFLVV
ncbi:hypothetical protein EZV62_026054 [Acer yangbiense]|uniref:FBD domain-containing protein n=1 Tax=Acer yangbiense TaxID=1000413 RepID=A0A5C7GQC3_9ROSI|nr:hypothetical protein EZV62_026054 [Acer yangbiense]